MNINIHELIKKVPAKGVLHVGANTCQELPLYESLGINRRIWIDGVEKAITYKEWVIQAFISDKSGETTNIYFANNNDESTSILSPLRHEFNYPQIGFERVVNAVRTKTINYLFSDKSWVLENINYLVLDIQGAELKALKGLGMFESHFEVIITEAYLDELYNGCGKLHDITDYLQDYQLIEFKEEVGKGWGDAAFIRKDLL